MNPLPQIQFFTSSDGNISPEAPLQDASVWLNEHQMAVLFDKDRSAINRHIKSVFDEEALGEEGNVQKIPQPQRISYKEYL